MEIDQLNDDCLRRIFDFIPISQLLSLEFISNRWKRLIQYRLVRQESLKLFCNDLELEWYNRNNHFYYHLKSCPYFKQNNDFMIINKVNYFTCLLILNKFPNLKMLLIVGCSFDSLNDLMFLLTELKNLKCFTFVFTKSLTNESYYTAMTNMLRIGLPQQFSNLKHLGLSFPQNTLINPFSNDFFNEIEELYLHNVTTNYDNYLDTKFNHQSNIIKLKKLALINTNKEFDMLENVKMCQILSKSIRELTYYYYSSKNLKNKFKLLCQNFTSLTYLDINVNFCVSNFHFHTKKINFDCLLFLD